MSNPPGVIRSSIWSVTAAAMYWASSSATGSFVAWNELKRPLQRTNSASRFNLMLVLRCCDGAYLGQIARMDEMAPFCALLGPNLEIFDLDLLQGLRAFYLDLLSSGMRQKPSTP
jgi:hypothetical protein